GCGRGGRARSAPRGHRSRRVLRVAGVPRREADGSARVPQAERGPWLGRKVKIGRQVWGSRVDNQSKPMKSLVVRRSMRGRIMLKNSIAALSAIALAIGPVAAQAAPQPAPRAPAATKDSEQ